MKKLMFLALLFAACGKKESPVDNSPNAIIIDRVEITKMNDCTINDFSVFVGRNPEIKFPIVNRVATMKHRITSANISDRCTVGINFKPCGTGLDVFHYDQFLPFDIWGKFAFERTASMKLTTEKQILFKQKNEIEAIIYFSYE